MKDFSSSVLAAAKNELAQENPIIWLVEAQVPTSPPTRFRFTNYSVYVPRGINPDTGLPIVYSPFPVAHGDLLQNNKGDLKGTTINVGNVTLELMEELEAYNGVTGQPIIIRSVPLNALGDPAAERRFDGVVMHVLIKQDVAVFSIGQANITQAPFPGRRVIADHCGVRQFGDAECGYLIPAGATNIIGGGFSVCTRSLSGTGGCNDHGLDEVARGLTKKHPLRFDAYPGTKQAASQ